MKRMKKIVGTALLCAFIAALSGCGSQDLGLNADQKGATDITAEANQQVYTLLNFDDEQEKKFAQKGLIAAPDELELKDENGKVIWSQKAYGFLDEAGDDVPDTVNPSLWRNTQNNHFYGLF